MDLGSFPPHVSDLRLLGLGSCCWEPLGCGVRLCIVLKAGEPHFHMQGGRCAFLDSLKANKLPRNGCVNLIFQAQTPLHEAGALCLPSGRTT